ncbi:Hypothetical protein R9X50_00160600 [Acrodontium crateriforme]|uniref:BZIP domain-containing protein n=1 Tax=Acrodontium crateriforme TaxID=150365 RepID=A0AAQ3M2R4_9PEZI|nr:Hypothetical protein R9X50_00160600 [Acrodontium crateriforme]
MSQGEVSSVSSTVPSTPLEDDWMSVRDPSKRRKIQNRIAQRRFREKVRQQREEAERVAENERMASGAYKPPDPEDIDDSNESGLPWGSLNIRHVIETGRSKEQNSRDTSVYAAASKAGGSSRVPGLHLIAEYARGSPSWLAWRSRLNQTLQSQE